MMPHDTIVALATGSGEAGLAVVRLSGPEAVAIASRVFKCADFGPNPRSHYAVYGILTNPSDSHDVIYDPVDQVLALPLLAPRSYTGEDTVEFFCHGGRVVAGQVVSACRAAGARPATAGEFSRRAFLNGKMSLDQAEAVADLIHAESRQAARAAMRQLLGGLNRQLSDIETPLLELLSLVEGSLEFTDEDEIEISPAETVSVLRDSVKKIGSLLELAPAGRLLRDGVQVVLAGPANAGKSSLFNALLSEDRAIVDDEAGTTRDVVSAAVEKNGTRFVFHDTAGLRHDAGRVEKMGIDRTLKAVAEADIVLCLFEPGGRPEPLPGVDRGQLEQVVVVPVMTKGDLAAAADAAGVEEAVITSSVDGRGLPELWTVLFRSVNQFRLNEAVALGVVINERHRHKLEQCLGELQSLVGEYSGGADHSGDPGPEVVGTMLASILSQLGEISGRVFSESLLESIFSRFCVGK